MTSSLNLGDRILLANRLASRPWHLLVLSAKSEASLDASTDNLVDHLKRNSELGIEDVAFTLQIGRQHFEYRRTVTCRSVADAIEALASRHKGRVHTVRQAAKHPGVAFVLPGENPPVNTAREIYETEAVFARELDRLAEQFRPLLNADLRRLLYPRQHRDEAAAWSLPDSGSAAAALFAIEYAMARLWESWGLSPAAVIGYGAGEYVSATIAGIVDLEDAAALAVMRGRVLCGELEQAEFVKLTKGLRLNEPRLPCISSVTGAWIAKTDALDPSYWLRQLQWASAAEAGVHTLAADGVDVLLQVGPGKCLPSEAETRGETVPLCLPTLTDPQSEASDFRLVTETLGHLYAVGVPIDWSGFYEGREPRRTPLPSYAFKRTRCWYTDTNPGGRDHGGDQAIPGRDAQKAEDHHTVLPSNPLHFANTSLPLRNGIEETLVSMCEDLLGIANVGVRDNVVELGADSLFTMQLSRRIGDVFGVSISPHHLFAEPNIASLASKIERLGPRSDRLEQGVEPMVNDRPAPGGIKAGDYERILTFVEGLSEAEVEEFLRRVAQ